ncbi:MAG: hypothetical protein Q8L81_00780 [Bacteroidota bacterium]|nr:hypothetical protein [Bacteroidota bacterium]
MNDNFFEKMTKHITELDTVYAEVFKNMSVAERMEYCKSLIDTTQAFLLKNDQFLNDNIRGKSNEIVSAALAELKELSKLYKKNNKK